MNPVKILWLQILVVCATVLGFVWAATQWTAWQLAFQPQLGEPWFSVFCWPVYQPTAFFWWWFAYDGAAALDSRAAIIKLTTIKNCDPSKSKNEALTCKGLP